MRGRIKSIIFSIRVQSVPGIMKGHVFYEVCRVLLEIFDEPEEVSSKGLRAKLKSPLTMSNPLLNVSRSCKVSIKNGTCSLLGA